MPALRNLKHERFAQNIAIAAKTKWSNGRCYREAGYRADGHAATMAASRLMTKDDIKVRLAELTAPAARKTATTVDTLAEQFDRVFDGAVAAEQFGAASNAAGLKAKLLGFMRERLEVGSVGQFDECRSVEEVIAALLAQEPAAELLASIDAFREQIATYAADHAQIVVAVDPARSAHGEAERSLALIRPKHRRH